MTSSQAMEHLKDLFPTVSEHFLRGLFEVYNDGDDSIDLNLIIDTVLSMEHLPQKENLQNKEQSMEQPSSIDVSQSDEQVFSVEASSPVLTVPIVDNVAKNDELLVTSSTPAKNQTVAVESIPSLKEADDMSSSNNEVLTVEQDDVVENPQTSNITISEICDVQPENQNPMISDNGNSTKEILSDKKVSTDTIENCDLNNHEDLLSNEVMLDESSFHNSNKELIDCLDNLINQVSNASVETIPKNGISTTQHEHTTKEMEVDTTLAEKFTPDELDSDTYCSKLVKTSDALINSSLEVKRSYASSEPPEEVHLPCSVEEYYSTTRNSGIQEVPKSPQRRRSDSDSSDQSRASYNGVKHAVYRSCKVKNDEQRLRRKLLRQSRMIKNLKEKRNAGDQILSQFESADAKFSLLSKVLPDADTDYLNIQSQTTKGEDLLDFITKSLASQNYPKKKEEFESKTMEMFECTIEEFLEEIPDPVAEFSRDDFVRTGYEQNAEIYLQSRYEGLDPEILKFWLETNGYNLTKVCEQLEADGQEPRPLRRDVVMHHPASIFFHQEIWFIEHRKEVQNFLDSVIEAAKIEVELNRPPTPVEEVFECGICSEEVVDYTELGTCSGAQGHLFCKNCIRRSTEIQFGEGATTFPCLHNCGGIIPLQVIEEVLPMALFEKLSGKIMEEEVRKANIGGVETCPFCIYAYGPGEEDQVFVCENPACMKMSCRICKKDPHAPEICDMFKNEDEETARHFVEERMTEALTRVCYSCGKKFVKENGCNKMTCQCGAKMCYLCRQPVQDYSHFNGQGGDNHDRCELFSEDERIHRVPVEASAQQALNQLIANNPGLNLDPTKIIPK